MSNRRHLLWILVVFVALPVSASWLSDATGINIDLATRAKPSSPELRRVVAQVDERLVQRFPAQQQVVVNPTSVVQPTAQKLDAVLARLGLAYGVETLGAKTYIACDHQLLGQIRKNVFGRVQILISFDTNGGAPMIRYAIEERRLRSVDWRKTEDDAIVRRAKDLVEKITQGFLS